MAGGLGSRVGGDTGVRYGDRQGESRSQQTSSRLRELLLEHEGI